MSETLYSSYGAIGENLYVTQIKRVTHYEMLRRHLHAYYEIYFLVSGERFLSIQNNRYHLKRGDIAFIPKNAMHRTSTTDNPAHERMAIHFTVDFMRNNFHEDAAALLQIFETSTPVHRVSSGNQRELVHLISRINDEILLHPQGYTVAIPHLVLELLLFACRNCGTSTAKSPEASLPIHRKVEEVTDYIRDFYHEPLTLTKLAQKFYISPYYLSRVFKEVTGISFIEYLNHIRIQEAQWLLCETNLKVLDIAERVGFRNIAHFGRIFKKETQTTPQFFRKANRPSSLESL